MSDKSAIEWTDATWNPVTGCTKVSPGCAHCYAETIAERFRGTPAFPNGFDVQLREHKLDLPKRWRKPRRIFVNSMSDLFHEDIPLHFIGSVYRTMLEADHHQYQVLTKRASRMLSLLTPETPKEYALVSQIHKAAHIWHGVSVENQHWAEQRIPRLARVQTAVRFLSCEPLLGPLDLTPWLDELQWVIVGGESGRGARRMQPAWARGIRDQCLATGVPFFFKQWGEHDEQGNRVGKKRAGAQLDGREWTDSPQRGG